MSHFSASLYDKLLERVFCALCLHFLSLQAPGTLHSGSLRILSAESHVQVSLLISLELSTHETELECRPWSTVFLWLREFHSVLVFLLSHWLLVVVQLPSCVWLFSTPWTAARQASLSLTISWSLPKFMSISLMMLSSHLILWHPLLPVLGLRHYLFLISQPPNVGVPKFRPVLFFSKSQLRWPHPLPRCESPPTCCWVPNCSLQPATQFHIQPASYLTSAHQWLVSHFNLSVWKAKFLSSSTRSQTCFSSRLLSEWLSHSSQNIGLLLGPFSSHSPPLLCQPNLSVLPSKRFWNLPTSHHLHC